MSHLLRVFRNWFVMYADPVSRHMQLAVARLERNWKCSRIAVVYKPTGTNEYPSFEFVRIVYPGTALSLFFGYSFFSRLY